MWKVLVFAGRSTGLPQFQAEVYVDKTNFARRSELQQTANMIKVTVRDIMVVSFTNKARHKSMSMVVFDVCMYFITFKAELTLLSLSCVSRDLSSQHHNY